MKPIDVNTIDVSIIICTLNRAESLSMTLDSIDKAIRNAPIIQAEVILINNGSTDDTQNVIEEWADSMPFPVKAIFELGKGLSRARNAGIKVASGEILVFTDDDCRLNTDYLLVLKRHYQNEIAPVMRGGKVELGDPSDMPFSIKIEDVPASMNETTHPGGFIIGANMILTRQIISKVGYFDNRFGAGAKFIAAEDTDYIYRCFKKGIPVEYSPDLIVKHYHGRKTKESISRLNYGYHIGGGALYAKHCFDWRLVRHFYWDFRKCVYELFGGTTLNAEMGLSHKDIVCGNIKGAISYFIETIRRGRFGFDYGQHSDHC